jgi:hypothetical protein
MPVKDSTTAHCHFDLAKLHGLFSAHGRFGATTPFAEMRA